MTPDQKIALAAQNQYGRDLEARVGVWRARFRGEA